MDHFGKLFGRKPEPPLEDKGKTPGQETARLPQSAPTVQSASGQVFGLNFTLESGETKTYTSLPISIGRNEKNDLVLSDMAVSAVHARVYFDAAVKDICIVDNNSLNGLFIDDLPTRKNVLFDGAKIRIGNTSLVFRDTGYIQAS